MRRAAVIGFATVCACVRPTDPPSSNSPDPDPSVSEVDPDGPNDPMDRDCTPKGLVFEDLQFVPVDVRFVSLRVRGPEAEPTAKAIAELPGTEGIAPFPILINVEFQGMWLESVVLESILGSLHTNPGELLEMHDPKGASVWVVPTACDIAILKHHAEENFGVTFRNGVNASIGTSPDPETFPFDIVLFTNRLALAPAGRGGRVVEWFESGGQAGAMGEPDKRPGERLLELEPAPVRLLIRGQALVAGDADPSELRARTVRAGSDFLEVDGTLID